MLELGIVHLAEITPVLLVLLHSVRRGVVANFLSQLPKLKSSSYFLAIVFVVMDWRVTRRMRDVVASWVGGILSEVTGLVHCDASLFLDIL